VRSIVNCARKHLTPLPRASPISADTFVGISSGQATTFSGLNSSWNAAYVLANADATRSPMNVELKNVAKTAMVKNARLLSGIIQNFPATTNAQRIDLGLSQRGTPKVPIPPPSMSPGITVTAVNGRIVSLRFSDPTDPTRRGKPPAVHSISVFSFVGDEAPIETRLFKFEGTVNTMETNVEFPATVAPGAKVWFTAFFANPRSESGLACAPISAYLQFGGDMPVAA